MLIKSLLSSSYPTIGVVISRKLVQSLLVLLIAFIFAWLFGGRLIDDLHHGLLERLPLHKESILVPDEVWRANIAIVPLHAAFKERQNVAVVWICRE